jgi:hypothetical protein
VPDAPICALSSLSCAEHRAVPDAPICALSSLIWWRTGEGRRTLREENPAGQATPGDARDSRLRGRRRLGKLRNPVTQDRVEGVQDARTGGPLRRAGPGHPQAFERAGRVDVIPDPWRMSAATSRTCQRLWRSPSRARPLMAARRISGSQVIVTARWVKSASGSQSAKSYHQSRARENTLNTKAKFCEPALHHSLIETPRSGFVRE